MRQAFTTALFWTLLAGCSGTFRTPISDPFRLCSWNIERLGYENGKDYQTVASILEQNCDASVLLEVMRKENGAPGYDALLTELGPEWTGARTDTPRPESASYSEYYAIVWRRERLEFCSGSAGLEFISDGTEGTAADRFDREPAFGCFRLRGGDFDFLLGAYHADWDDSVSVVQDEVRFIDDAAAAILSTRPGEADLLLFGDFNLTPENLAEVTELTIFGSGDGSTLNASGGRTRNLYDNLLVASLSATPELVDRAEVLDVREEAGGPESYAESVSDHLPIRVLLYPLGEDDD